MTRPARPFLDSMAARLLALVIALLVLFAMYNIWGGHNVPKDSLSLNPSLDACLEKRIADVDRMKGDGVITPNQYGLYRARAIVLCEGQNPL